ncbi:Non-motile and phage-resistance protein [Massilia sp. Bi118]|uniref:ATP-binding protein n=1 Tax=Massilia sp. Bi118 TaxID=2822346 RepID=UPI001D497EBD|nr:ATP-binding protein [Massilia sp. Bi118]CAH0198752.1 Non-motile and phage-resistance protein [Massilia sp. Bi118]
MPPEPAAASTQSTRGRVLFVCDRADVDPAVAGVAAELGYEVLRVRSAGEALEHTAAPGFALILAGYAENVDAFAGVLRRLRAAFPLTPLVAIGLPPRRDFSVDALYEAGALSVLEDPISPPVLRAKARFYLDAYATAAERTRTQAALEETQARLESTIAAADVGIWSWEVGADRVIGDARVAALYGLNEGEEGAPLSAWLDAIHPDDQAAMTARLRDAVARCEPYEATYRVRSAEGGWRWILARAQSEPGPQGAARLRGVVIDATTRKQAEERLQATEERYHTLFDAVDVGVCVIEMLYDGEGKPCDYRFLEVNPAFALRTGLLDAAGKTMLSLAPAHERHWFDLYGRVADTGEPVRFIQEAAQLGRCYDVCAARVGPAGSHKVALLFTDITERRHTELELRRLADGLAEEDRRKTEFLATLAHELRNPLAPIRSGLQLMRRTKGDPAALGRVQDIMDRQLDHLVHLVDDLLDVARITRGQIELKPAWIDLEDVVRAALDTSMPLIDAARHRLDLRLPAAPVRLYADAVRLTQVLSNLLNNAAKYTPRGGAIVVAVERNEDQANIVVSDNGIGIPPESLDSVFQMFTQIAHPAQRSQGGLGIGLSLVRSLVELHGGSITAASPGIDGGSVFTVRLPLAGKDRREPAPAAPAPAQAAPAGLKVLVVDDNRDAADTLAALLGIMGHSAPVAADGYQALRMIASLDPDIVFLDIGMPGMSGHEVAQAVRADPQFDNVRLVALTGWGGEADRARSSAAGFDAHLTKPATVAAIEETLARLAPR